MRFTEQEVEYLRSQPLARLATVNSDGGPDVVPVAFEFDGTFFWVGGVGEDVLGTRKLRNIGAGRSKVSLVIDDLVSIRPFVARALRVYGDAEPAVERTGRMGPASTPASRRRCHGAGIWQANLRGSAGMTHIGPFMSRDLQ